MNKELCNSPENITENENDAEAIWRLLKKALETAGKSNVFKNPTVVDLGGRYAEFSKYLNAEGINCISIDIENLRTTPNSNQVRADMYKMPFADESIDIITAIGSLDSKIYKHDFPKLLLEIARVLKKGGIFSSTSDATPEFIEDFPHDIGNNFKIISEPNERPFLLEKK